MHFARYEGAMAKRKAYHEKADDDVPISVLERQLLWQLDIVELAGHNLEARGQEELTGFSMQDGGCSIFTRSNMRRTACGANGQWGF